MTAADDTTMTAEQAREMAGVIMAHHFGTPADRIEERTGGLSNFVFEAAHAHGRFIVRIAPDHARINAFYKEQWAFSRAREEGVPTAEILEVGNECVPMAYMVSRAVEGHEATHHPKREAIVQALGHYARLINGISTTGFGRTFDWSSNLLSRNHSWPEFLHQELKLEQALELLTECAMLDGERAARVRAALDGVDAGEPSLNHGDLRLKNVIVNDAGEVQAILDWENCLSAPATAWELSIALHDLSIDEKELFLAGYGLPPNEIGLLAPVWRALNVVNYAPEVERMAAAGDEAGLERLRVRLSGALDLYTL